MSIAINLHQHKHIFILYVTFFSNWVFSVGRDEWLITQGFLAYIAGQYECLGKSNIVTRFEICQALRTLKVKHYNLKSCQKMLKTQARSICDTACLLTDMVEIAPYVKVCILRNFNNRVCLLLRFPKNGQDRIMVRAVSQLFQSNWYQVRNLWRGRSFCTV